MRIKIPKKVLIVGKAQPAYDQARAQASPSGRGLRVTSDLAELKGCTFFVVAVPTPVGRSSNTGT